MKEFIFWLLLLLSSSWLLTTGCAGTGFQKKITLVPDSMSLGYYQEVPGEERWRGISIDATWEFK